MRLVSRHPLQDFDDSQCYRDEARRVAEHPSVHASLSGIHTETFVGCTVIDTTACKSAVTRSKSTLSRSRTATWPALIVVVATGSRGHAVRAVQRQLNARTSPLAVDGVFGAQTDLAVRGFQQANGLLIDGIVGRRTWFALVTAAEGRPLSRSVFLDPTPRDAEPPPGW